GPYRAQPCRTEPRLTEPHLASPRPAGPDPAPPRPAPPCRALDQLDLLELDDLESAVQRPEIANADELARHRQAVEQGGRWDVLGGQHLQLDGCPPAGQEP